MSQVDPNHTINVHRLDTKPVLTLLRSPTVEGLDWSGAATPSSIWSGSFSVAFNPTEKVLPSDLAVESASYRNISPVFHIAVNKKVKNRLVIQFVVPVGGIFPVILKFRGNPINPDQGGNWCLYSNDASLSLTSYIPGVPPVSKGFSIRDSGTGIQASVQGNMLHFAKDTSQPTRNQWKYVRWDLPSLDDGPSPIALFLTYRIRWNNLKDAHEVKLHAPTLANPSEEENVVLQFYSGKVNWRIYDHRRPGFVTSNPSGISANGEWHDILFYVASDAIRVYEDGRNVVSKARSGFLLGSFDMNHQVLEEVGVFDSDLMDFNSCPAAFHQDLPELMSTPTELIFNSASSIFNRQYFSVSNWNGPIKVTQTENSLRFSTQNLTLQNNAVYTSHVQSLRDYSVVQYRFKINAASGSETKIVIAGNVTLRTQYGISRWQFWDGSSFHTISSTTNLRPNGPYVDVLVVVSPGLVTLFENGKFNFEHVVSPPGNSSSASFSVQHLEVGGEVDVELSHLRIVSGALPGNR